MPLLLLLALPAGAQQYLQKPVTLDIRSKPVTQVLDEISKQGGFQFSYNTQLFRGDSIVSISVQGKPVKQCLDLLFHGKYEYKEAGHHVVIQPPSSGDVWYLSGYVYDQRTGERVRDASVYETQQLVATLTNDQGYFRLRLKDKHPTAAISVRKAWYFDTSLVLNPGYSQELTVSITPKSFTLDTVVVSPVEKSWLTNLFLSSRQRAQNLNLGKFFVDRPYQTSFVPGLGTHGKMGSHVVNKFSFNVVGGYTAGTQGIEIGGVFNIVNQDMSFLQIAGVFNMIGGKATGVQIGGVFNQALDSVTGVQVAGVANRTSGPVKGVQTSGVINHTSQDVTGIQVTGVINNAKEGVRGMQLSGFANRSGGTIRGMQLTGAINIAKQKIRGVQMSGLLNVAKNIDGVQIGIINIADSTSQFSIGLLNIFRNGYYKLSLFTNESVPYNVALKTGTSKLHGILLAGITPTAGKQIFTYGYGFGTDISLEKRLSFVPEATAQYCYRGNPSSFAMIYKAAAGLNLKITNYLSVFVAPSLSVYHYDADAAIEAGYDNPFPEYGTMGKGSKDLRYWFGGNAGIALF